MSVQPETSPEPAELPKAVDATSAKGKAATASFSDDVDVEISKAALTCTE
jgi:hypothetical protein